MCFKVNLVILNCVDITLVARNGLAYLNDTNDWSWSNFEIYDMG